MATTLKPKEEKVTASTFISKLFSLRIQAHIFHLQVTEEGSFAMHSALDELYKEIPELTDALVETYQGESPIVLGYILDKMVDFEDKKELLTYLEGVLDFIETNRLVVFPAEEDSDLLNIVDEIKSLIRGTMYKIRRLA